MFGDKKFGKWAVCPNCDSNFKYYRGRDSFCLACKNKIIWSDFNNVKIPKKFDKYRKKFIKYTIWAFASPFIVIGIWFVLNLMIIFIIRVVTNDRNLALAFAVGPYQLPVVMTVVIITMLPLFVMLGYYLFKANMGQTYYFLDLMKKFLPPSVNINSDEDNFLERLNINFKYCQKCFFINSIDAKFCQDCGEKINSNTTER